MQQQTPEHETRKIGPHAQLTAKLPEFRRATFIRWPADRGTCCSVLPNLHSSFLSIHRTRLENFNSKGKIGPLRTMQPGGKLTSIYAWRLTALSSVGWNQAFFVVLPPSSLFSFAISGATPKQIAFGIPTDTKLSVTQTLSSVALKFVALVMTREDCGAIQFGNDLLGHLSTLVLSSSTFCVPRTRVISIKEISSLDQQPCRERRGRSVWERDRCWGRWKSPCTQPI